MAYRNLVTLPVIPADSSHVTRTRRSLKVVAHQPKGPRLIPFKRWAAEMGIPYRSARAAHLRGDLPVVKIGTSEKWRHWYVDRADGDRWILSLKEDKPS